ncbi:RsiV family protein [Psychrobacter sp. M13]|uniref:RsiV family protein n=1 Tax=Psychrobacter sp. M13 TaxID=3067275 RepID=UPI00273B4246|nr:RsiV family protein [Psychrobacter sp. M13]WLP94989.1 RsiV family protein [Psychrobacter sp. M13]
MLLNPVKINTKILIKPFLAVMVSSAFTIHASASTLISSTDYLEYELPQSIQDECYERSNCPKIEVKYLNTNHDWINSIVNARINNIIVYDQSRQAPIDMTTNSSLVKMAIDDFAKSQFADLPDDVPWSYELIIKPDYLGHVKLRQSEDLELFEINSYVFTGGAHGMPTSEYLIFDPNTKTQIKLADMLQEDKKPYFEALAYNAYKEWVKTVDDDISSYEESWPFMLSDNITLTDKGIDIRYQHYAIGPYAYGMPVLSISYNKLNGIIKPNFLPK